MRAIEKKGELQNFLETHQPDIVCFQETKAKPEQLEFLEEKFPEYQKFYHSAEKAGYAGTDIIEGIYKSFKVQKVYVKK